MRRFAAFALLAAFAACHGADEDNIEARAQNQSERLQQRYNEIQAEAENDVAEQTAPLDAETENLLNQMNQVAVVNGTSGNAFQAKPR